MPDPSPSTAGGRSSAHPKINTSRFGKSPARQRRLAAYATSPSVDVDAYEVSAGPGADELTIDDPASVGRTKMININNDLGATLDLAFTNVYFGGAWGVNTINLGGDGAWILLISVMNNGSALWAEVASAGAS